MTDFLDAAGRSALMSRVRRADTNIEQMVAAALRARGKRFARHAADLPGTPDIVFRRLGVAVFIEGDFWHGWRFSKWAGKLQPFWREKIARNRRRDTKNTRALRRRGWRVVRLWEHAIKADVDECVRRVIAEIDSRTPVSRNKSRGRGSSPRRKEDR